MRITPTSGLSPEEIDNLLAEAAASVESDREAKHTVILRTKLESLLRNTQKSFAKFGGLLSSNDQDIAERVFVESEAAAKSKDVGEINKALNGLERIAAQLTAAMLNPAKGSSSPDAKDPG